jgi:hypothetical protein
MAEAKWVNGYSTLPQARSAETIDWSWVDGWTNKIPVDVYSGSTVSSSGMVSGYLVHVGNINYFTVSRQSSRHQIRIGR